MYDIVGTKGVAADLSHLNCPCKVSAFEGADALGDALVGADLVIIPAGVGTCVTHTHTHTHSVACGLIVFVSRSHAHRLGSVFPKMRSIHPSIHPSIHMRLCNVPCTMSAHRNSPIS